MTIATSPQTLNLDNVAETVEDLIKNKAIHPAEGCLTTIDDKLYVIIMGAAVSVSGTEEVRDLPLDFHVDPLSTSYRSRSYNILDAALTNKFSVEMILMMFHSLEILHHEVLEIWKGEKYDYEGMVFRLREQINEVPNGLAYFEALAEATLANLKAEEKEENND